MNPILANSGDSAREPFPKSIKSKSNDANVPISGSDRGYTSLTSVVKELGPAANGLLEDWGFLATWAYQTQLRDSFKFIGVFHYCHQLSVYGFV
jgi:hypothetical protein